VIIVNPARNAEGTEGTRRRASRPPLETSVCAAPDAPPSSRSYHHPSASWGAAKSVTRVLLEQGELREGTRAIANMNHEDGGFDCPGCAWPDSLKGLHLDICENGIKHVTWEMTRKRAGREFFAAHTVTELEGWTDFALEDQGRLTEPMVYDPDTDHYVPISWKDAFEVIGSTLRELGDPDQAAFYTSGRLGNEATFLPVDGARAGHQQPAGLLQHVPRGQRPGPDRGTGHRQGHL
jgi:anaerobic selenocysteine-containing dehydrogenase